VDEPERINIPAPQNLTMPEIQWSDHVKQLSRYIRDLTSREFTMGSDKEKFPTGLQVPELEEEVTGLAMLAAMSNACGLKPRSLNEAKKSTDWPRWKEAMDEELVALEAHNTWEVVDKLKNINIVGCRWTFIIKKDAAGNIIRYKVRLVAQGFSQVQGIDFFDTYTPIAKMATIRMVLALAACYDHEIHQVDIKNAFLNRKFEDNETIHMRFPPGVEITKEDGKVLKLSKPLYGLRQSCIIGTLTYGEYYAKVYA
jgi:hypothetical protein